MCDQPRTGEITHRCTRVDRVSRHRSMIAVPIRTINGHTRTARSTTKMVKLIARTQYSVHSMTIQPDSDKVQLAAKHLNCRAWDEGGFCPVKFDNQ